MARIIDRHATLLIWICVSLILMFVSREAILAATGFGPDDQLRQLQLRDWLGGQSWFDTTQYRIGWPTSEAMHWPRWIELMLAIVVVPLTPIVGAGAAEVVAMVAIPLLWLLALMVLVERIGARLFGRKVAILAMLLAATAVPLLAQLRPMRIDHHGVQVVLALVVLWSLFGKAARASGIIQGVATAIWLSISLEGLPLAVALAGLVALRWVIGVDDGKRLFGLMAGLTATSVALYLAVHGLSGPWTNWCDAVAPVHLYAMGAATIILLPVTAVDPAKLALRWVGLVVGAGAGLAILLAIEPGCLTGALRMDPLVDSLWYRNVREGMPIWQQDFRDTAVIFGGVILTGLMALPLLWSTPGLNRRDLLTLSFAFVAAVLMALLVHRAAATAAAFALPFAGWLVEHAFRAARQIERPVTRILATAGVAMLVLPGPLALAFYDALTGAEPKDNKLETASEDGTPPCYGRASIERLNALPGSRIVAPFNAGPRILLATPHDVLATSHHRNNAAMADQLKLFTGNLDSAHEIVKQRQIAFIIACADDPEMKAYARRYPDGFWATLKADKAPNWLQRVHLKDSGLMVWRVSR